VTNAVRQPMLNLTTGHCFVQGATWKGYARMTNLLRKRRQKDNALFREHAFRYWEAETKRLRKLLDDAEWEGQTPDKLATLKEALTNARQRQDKCLTN